MTTRKPRAPPGKPQHDHPLVLALRLLGGKWSMHALIHLHFSPVPLRFNDLQRAIGQVTRKELTRNLRILERAGVISRTVHAEVPPRVEYTITPMGKGLVGPLDSLNQWAEAHARALRQAQADRPE